jgi:hypothetical protein
MPARPFHNDQSKILSANDLRTGDVIYAINTRLWSRRLVDARIFHEAAAAAAAPRSSKARSTAASPARCAGLVLRGGIGGAPAHAGRGRSGLSGPVHRHRASVSQASLTGAVFRWRAICG